jgi:DNA-binding LytR/AlgR family response regulator
MVIRQKEDDLERSDELQNILEKLNYIDPPIKKFPVTPEDPSMTISLVDLKDVCYITTKSTAGREETGFVTSNNKTYYSNLRLTEIEKKLAVHPHFMRTSKFYMVNLTKIRALRVSSARDLWFEGLEEPVINAVTSTYLSEFLERMKL